MQVKLPTEYTASDYHEFNLTRFILNKVLDNGAGLKKMSVDFVETGVWDRDYHAFFYDTSKKPTNRDVLEFYMESQKGQFKTTQELKSHFESGWLNQEFLTDLDDVINQFSVQEGFLKTSKKSLKMKK